MSVRAPFRGEQNLSDGNLAPNVEKIVNKFLGKNEKESWRAQKIALNLRPFSRGQNLSARNKKDGPLWQTPQKCSAFRLHFVWRESEQRPQSTLVNPYSAATKLRNFYFVGKL